ncbi:hypothetical protein FBZ93_12713 [Bradyrhizobium macuxiense]|uniref:Uncharacterized protein n=1 Tax=Bradyrhizobium macuxiense TaxID=1755647 RepID=A0A560KUH2_9BRAD|nr:hypothetical protein [Bradyrhizobium macuxiense]TWB86799.1 hypothetical protein FBZ93_12713 [Bradyrhizobium macuxiense]
MPRDNIFINGRTLSVLLDRALLALSAVTTAILFAWLLYYSSYDLGSEGFYPNLNIQSVSMVMIGLLLADRPGRMCQVLGRILVGVGGWCCFMAKPITAAAIALVVMLYVVVLRRKSLRPTPGEALIALALLIVNTYLIGDGITGLVTRMVNGSDGITLLGAGHAMSRILRIDWLETSRSQLGIAVLVPIALLLSILMGATHKLIASLALAAMLIVTIAVALLRIHLISIDVSTLFLVPAFTCLGAMFYREGLVLRTQTPTSIVLALTFLVLPHLLALSRALNYWTIGSSAALF